MRIYFLFLVALNLFAGWLPSDAGNTDWVSMINFVVATACAYCAGGAK